MGFRLVATGPPPAPVSERRFRWLVLAAVLVGLALRVVWGLSVAREPSGLVDSTRYLATARQIAAGHGLVEPLSGYPTAYYPPGYPLFLGAVAWLSRPFTDDLPRAIVLVQAVLGALSCGLGAVFVRRIAGAAAGVAAAFGLALYPNLIFHSGTILGETLYIALFLAFLVALTTGGLGQVKGRVVLGAGVVLGLAVLVRPISLAIVPVATVAWLVAGLGRRRALAATGILVAGVALCVVPWTVRNAIRLHEFVPISTNTGDNLCIGHGPEANGAFEAREDCRVDHDFLDGPAEEVAADRAKTRLALRAIADAPGREPWLLWRRTWFMWVRDGDHDGILAAQSYRLDRFIEPTIEARLTRTADLAYWALIPFALGGLVLLTVRRTPEGVLLVGSAVMTALVPLAFFGDSRFKVPVIPLLIMAATTLVAVARPSPPERLPAEAP